MSESETELTREYWRENGGTLIEEFYTGRIKGNSRRYLDGVIVLSGEKQCVKSKQCRINGQGRKREHEVEIKDREIVIVQTKRKKLCMYLLGQAYFSKFLMEPFEPDKDKIRSVAICIECDEVLCERAKEHGIEVVRAYKEHGKTCFTPCC